MQWGTPQSQSEGNRSDGPYQPYQPYEPYESHRPSYEEIPTAPVLPAMPAIPATQAAPAMPVSPKPLLLAQDVVKQFKVGGGGTVTALRHVTLAVGEGRIVAIRGRSGAGKTTLLNIIAGLDSPTSGHVALFGRDLATLNERKRTELRRHDLGFVFQAAHLNPVLTARENVEVPLRLARTARKEREGRSHEALALVGLAEREKHRPPELSGGEQQRVAIARALVHAPRIVLADEPTGNLDSHTGLAILDLMRRVAHRAGITFIVTTHDPQASQMADEVYDISDGVLTPGQR
ncbi:MAG TPA: ATP-binding cassette domain-containing protein [Ktedonobacterales bacterium]|nr:ATP-binding cassette domain-containing protein [Ktedonobacterales bacterium]